MWFGDLCSLGKYHVVSPWCVFTRVFHPCSPLYCVPSNQIAEGGALYYSIPRAARLQCRILILKISMLLFIHGTLQKILRCNIREFKVFDFLNFLAFEFNVFVELFEVECKNWNWVVNYYHSGERGWTLIITNVISFYYV